MEGLMGQQQQEGAYPNIWMHWAACSLRLYPTMLAGYFGYCFLIHNLVHHLGLGSKIQPARKETLRVKFDEAKWSVVCITIGALYLGFCTAGYERGLTKVYFRVEDYGWLYLFGSFIGMWLVNDAWQYWTHRALHTNLGFKMFHRIHHKFNAPSTYATMAFHPVESCVQFHPSLLIFVAPVYFPLMVAVSLLFFTISVMEHSGFYILPYERFSWLFSTPIHHDLHHSRFRYNFAVYFTFWDRLCGTFLHELPPHLKHLEGQTAPAAINSTPKAKAS